MTADEALNAIRYLVKHADAMTSYRVVVQSIAGVVADYDDAQRKAAARTERVSYPLPGLRSPRVAVAGRGLGRRIRRRRCAPDDHDQPGAAVASGVPVEGMAMMDADVHAWARERIVQALYDKPDDGSVWADTARLAADAVLAVLPELLTDERTERAISTRLGEDDAWIEQVLAAAAGVLVGEQP